MEEDSLPSLPQLLAAGEEEWVTSDLCQPPPNSSTAEKLLQNGTYQTYLLCCCELDEKINTAVMPVW